MLPATPTPMRWASMESDDERMHGLDALRAIAMLLVIVLHGAIPYVDLPLGRLPWAIRDSASSRLITHLFWWLHAVLMPLFFLLAGCFAARLLATRGRRGFLRHRARRLLVPALAGSVVLLPVTFAVFAGGWWLGGACTWNEIRRLKFQPPIQAELFGPAHLWFLEYLFLYCLLAWAVAELATLATRRRRSGALQHWSQWRALTPAASVERRDREVSLPVRMLGCGLLTALLVAAAPEVFISHHNSFIPSPAGLLYYGVFFVFGGWLYRAPLHRFRRGGAAWLACALPLSLCAEAVVRAHPGGTLAIGARVLLALAVAAAAWLSIHGLLSLCASMCTQPRVALRYLADASYWVYLIHLPIVAGLQIGLAQLPASPLLKCAAVSAIAAAVCLWSYTGWVRHTAIGALLDGHPAASPRRRQRVPVGPASVPVRRAERGWR